MTQLPDNRSPLVQLSARLRQSKIDWDAENIADLLWLSRYVEGTAVQEQQAQSDQSKTSRVRTETLEDGDLPPPPPPDLSLYAQVLKTQQPSKSKPSASGIPFQAPTAPALRKTLSIGRSLRPFMRKVDSYTRTVLNEEATAEQTAEQRFCMTVVAPDQERWLEVALVIEDTASSFIWQETIQEFKQLLEHQGAFRSVSVWYLQVSGSGEMKSSETQSGEVKAGQVKLFSQRPGSQHQATRSLKELVDPAGRRLILVMSDCISVAWQQGIMQATCLDLWAKHGPIAIVQLLPGRLWGRTALRLGVMVELSALTPGVPNQALCLHEVPIWSESQTDRGLKLPIVTLEPEALDRWARMVAGFGEHRASGVWFDEGWQQWQQEEPVLPESLKSEQLVHRFNATASLLARQLAIFMAFVPIQLPIIYLIQATMLPDSTPLHLAEVFMSGLIQREENSGVEAGKTYDFVPGVRELLIDLVDRREAEVLLDRVSQYIGQKIGQTIYSFTALLRLEKQRAGTAGTDLLKFAHITKQAVQRLGGEYAAFVQALEDAPLSGLGDPDAADRPITFPSLQTLEFITAQLVDSLEPPLTFPPLQTEQFTVATLTLEPEQNTLQSFEFKVATLSRRQTGLRRRTEWVIQRQRQQAWRLMEPLVDNLMLEMVSIPGGQFFMGSPQKEPERFENESPQHEVEVADFLMGRYPITQRQWRVVAALPKVDRDLPPDPSYFKGDNRPVEQVSWHDTTEFCARLRQHTGRSYRLPTEAEWEYACRAGTTTPFHFGEMIIPDLANYAWNQTYNKSNVTKKKNFDRTTSVDHFGIANAYGLCDMRGNVWEWCQDHWHENYEGAPTDGRAWVNSEADENAARVLRGGSWYSNPRNCRSASRFSYDAGDRYYGYGFRVVCLAPRTL